MIFYKHIIIIFITLVILSSCKRDSNRSTNNSIAVSLPEFQMLDPQSTGIQFRNTLIENDSLNYFTYGYIYMGGGVAAGDINNDGLIDLYFTGNQVSNKLYLNKGNLKFEDITMDAGVGGDNRWFTGVTMADVDGDGFLDIYCSVGGKFGPKENLFFHNNGDLTFTEKGGEYGIANNGNSVQGTFFDYDRDGDLDLYVANYPPTPFNARISQYQYKMRHPKPEETDRLYRNEGGRGFVDITKEAGLLNFGLTLSVTASDINKDSWPDLYLSNDFSSPDFFYLNQKDGTFKEVVKEATANTSFYSMGTDIADFNNDLWPDIFQVDMSPADNRRSKANMASMNPQIFYSVVNAGFHNQFMQNSLQLNTGLLQNGVPKFQNIARLAGVASTDWSWAPLFMDLDNDGWKDLFVANGARREINNRDYFRKISKSKNTRDSLLQKSLNIPSEPIDNFILQNRQDLTFDKVNLDWGISYQGFTNGSTYADLNNDGALELILNNIDDYAVLFSNTAEQKKNYLDLKLQGNNLNTSGLGAKVILKQPNGTKQYQELTLSRGFQSSVAPRLHFGLGTDTSIDSLEVIWPDGKQQILTNIEGGQLKVLLQNEAVDQTINSEKTKTTFLFTTVRDSVLSNIVHTENKFDDYKQEILLPYETSKLGPAIAVGDLDNNGLEDLFLGGAASYSGRIFLQTTSGFVEKQNAALQGDKDFEDVGASIFDADSDGDLDIYIVSGGNEFEYTSPLLQDRLYINDGNGNFSRSKQALPTMLSSGSRAYPFDYDKDGDLDLFVAGRLIPGNYPIPADSFLLENKSTPSEPKFENITSTAAPELKELGLATAALWTDYNADGWTDLIIVGEWMPITIFKNNEGQFENVSDDLKLKDSRGWWYSIAELDYDLDGDLDYVVGNLGQNMKYQASKEETFDIYLKDFDKNTRNDIVLSYYDKGKKYPVRGRECSSQQIPRIKKQFKDYESFSNATLEDIYGKNDLSEALHYEVSSFASCILENTDDGFIRKELPKEAQFSSINQMLVGDYDNDGIIDILAAGNMLTTEVETPQNDAGIGIFLKGNGKEGFEVIQANQSGLFIPGDVKDLKAIKINNESHVIVAKNSDTLQLVKILKKETKI